MQPNGSNLNTGNTDGSPRSVVNTTIQAPRRKFVDEGKLRKVKVVVKFVGEIVTLYALAFIVLNHHVYCSTCFECF